MFENRNRDAFGIGGHTSHNRTEANSLNDTSQRANCSHCRAFSRYFTTVHFFGCPSGFTADVEQRGVYRRCRDSRIVIHPVSAATSNAGASRYSRIDRIATDALSGHRER